MATQQHCQVLEVLGELESLIYRCPQCGEKIEVLIDDPNKKHACSNCGKQIDFMKRPHSLYGNEDLRPLVDNHPKAPRPA